MPDDEEREWSGEELHGMSRIVREHLLPHFHTAIAEAILEIGGGFTDERRVAIGSALLMTLTEAMLGLWANSAETVPPEVAYKVLALQLTQAMPLWLGLGGDAEADSTARKTMQDVHERAMRFGEQTGQHLAALVESIEQGIAAATVPHPQGDEGVAAALYAQLGRHLSCRFKVGADPQRMHLWCQTVLAGFGVLQIDMLDTTGAAKPKAVH